MTSKRPNKQSQPSSLDRTDHPKSESVQASSRMDVSRLSPPPPPQITSSRSQSQSRSQSRVHSRTPSHSSSNTQYLDPTSSVTTSAPISPITSRRRQSQRLSQMAGRADQPFAFPAVLPPSHPHNLKPSSGLLSAFSPFTSSNKTDNSRPILSREPTSQPLLSVPQYLQAGDRSNSIISLAPSTRAPSDLDSPRDEIIAGLGGHGIEDYEILSEAGKGAYGMVKRARSRVLKNDNKEGEEVIIKYIIKSRILADCWKKYVLSSITRQYVIAAELWPCFVCHRHKVLGPIPIESE